MAMGRCSARSPNTFLTRANTLTRSARVQGPDGDLLEPVGDLAGPAQIRGVPPDRKRGSMLRQGEGPGVVGRRGDPKHEAVGRGPRDEAIRVMVDEDPPRVRPVEERFQRL